MTIVIQSLLKQTSNSEPAFLIRYFDIGKLSEETLKKSEEAYVPAQITSAPVKSSFFIIRREYAYLESVIRETFGDANDVQVFVDRRRGERRKTSNGFVGKNLRTMDDRRQSIPILDVVISLSGSSS